MPSSEIKPAREGKRGPITQLVFLLLGGAGLGAVFFQAAPAAVGMLTRAIFKDATSSEPRSIVFSQIGAAIFGFILGLGIANWVWDGFTELRRNYEKQSSGGKLTLFIAIFIALVACVPFLFFLYTFLAGNMLMFLGALCLLISGFSLMSMYVLGQISDILPWNQGEGPRARTGVKIMDTNVLIDGRIDGVIRTGFLSGPFYVPQFVLEELQYIADSSDPLRRQRGRRGLEVLRLMQADFPMEVATKDHLAGNPREPVDHRLVKLARALGADIVTNDFNLNRVAALQDVQVLNLNDLALAMRTTILPGETKELAIIREGNQQNQGVGYLDDGTMVVVEGGKRFLGETIELVVSQVIQTERGKMIFGTPLSLLNEEDPNLRRPPARRPQS